MIQRGRGAVVTMASSAARLPGLGAPAPYVAAKAGVIGLARALAVELAPEVRVNGVAPGTVLPPEGMDAEALAKRIPLGRIGEPEDAARAVLFLAGEPFITGEILTVDGGRSLNPWSSPGI
jgi:pteridine reductase